MSYGPYTLTGEGLVVFGTTGGILVTDVDLTVTSYNARTRVIGDDYPKGLWHVGSVALGWSPGDAFGSDTEIYEQHFLTSERQDWHPTNKRVDVFVTTLFYKLTTGVTVVAFISNL